jgi:small subunit ribosomal protein S20
VANIKSQIKRNRQNEKKRLRNRVYRGEARIAVRNARTTIEEGVPESKVALLEAVSALDKAAEQGVIHKNNAARRKSRLMKAFAKMEPVKMIAEPASLEAGLETEPAVKAAKGRKKVVQGKAAARNKVTEPTTEAVAEPKAESKKTAAKTTEKKTAASSSRAKKPAASSSTKVKKPASKSSTSGKKKTSAKKD